MSLTDAPATLAEQIAEDESYWRDVDSCAEWLCGNYHAAQVLDAVSDGEIWAGTWDSDHGRRSLDQRDEDALSGLHDDGLVRDGRITPFGRDVLEEWRRMEKQR